ncbi:nose resistant to fluoxetine protein 6-like [Battus philenor]|uniref:nose resistant to fluoxetine protein 6-like n=1 Tax=Battus philenor TaxID=42288 RepID=UPI0035CEDB9E
MGVLWFLFVLLPAGNAFELTMEQYYQMPQLFELDDYVKCLSQKNGAFCLGTFDLVASSNVKLFNDLQKFSENTIYFNHTRIHRGYCVSSRCNHIEEPFLSRRFTKCVNNLTKNDYELEAKIATLEYCRTAKTPPAKPIDELDISFAYLCGFIIIMNVLGTLYYLLRNPDNKPMRWLLAWSLTESWKRLTDSYENGDPRLSALEPVHGMKAITLIMVLMAHSVIIYHTAYLFNPFFLEYYSYHPLSTFFHNGSVIVQTFIVLSSFLLSYNLLIYVENNPKKELNLKMLPNVLINRIARITPANIVIIGFAMTWWRHASDGPLWKPLVDTECSYCRDKWWTQLLFINNFIKNDVICLVHTWFLAVDMQLYVLAAILTLTLGRSLLKGIKLLSFMYVLSMVVNFLATYYWNFKPVIFFSNAEAMRKVYTGEPTFTWWYSMPWSSLPASLLGLIIAFLHYYWQQQNYNPQESLLFRILYRSTVPLMFLCIQSGYFIVDITSPLVIAGYAALDRPIFALLTAIALLGFIYKIDHLWWSFLSWSGWRPLSRMSLSIYLVHLFYNYTQVAVKTNLARASIYEIGGHWFVTIFMTYITALPVHLFVEIPVHQFVKSFT